MWASKFNLLIMWDNSRALYVMPWLTLKPHACLFSFETWKRMRASEIILGTIPLAVHGVAYCLDIWYFLISTAPSSKGSTWGWTWINFRYFELRKIKNSIIIWHGHFWIDIKNKIQCEMIHGKSLNYKSLVNLPCTLLFVPAVGAALIRKHYPGPLL